MALDKSGRIYMDYINLNSQGDLYILGKGYYDSAININNSFLVGSSGIEILGYGHSNSNNTSGIIIQNTSLNSFNSGNNSLSSPLYAKGGSAKQ